MLNGRVAADAPSSSVDALLMRSWARSAEMRGWDEGEAAVRDLHLLRSLARRFEPGSESQDELAQQAFYRISGLLDTLGRLEEQRSDAYADGQKEMAESARDALRKNPDITAAALVWHLFENFGVTDPA